MPIPGKPGEWDAFKGFKPLRVGNKYNVIAGAFQGRTVTYSGWTEEKENFVKLTFAEQDIPPGSIDICELVEIS